MLRSAEYGEIKPDYDRVSRTHFPAATSFPDQMSFANSDALFSSGELSAAIAANTRASARFSVSALPVLGDVQARFMELRNLL